MKKTILLLAVFLLVLGNCFAFSFTDVLSSSNSQKVLKEKTIPRPGEHISSSFSSVTKSAKSNKSNFLNNLNVDLGIGYKNSSLSDNNISEGVSGFVFSINGSYDIKDKINTGVTIGIGDFIAVDVSAEYKFYSKNKFEVFGGCGVNTVEYQEYSSNKEYNITTTCFSVTGKALYNITNSLKAYGILNFGIGSSSFRDANSTDSYSSYGSGYDYNSYSTTSTSTDYSDDNPFATTVGIMAGIRYSF